MEGGHDECFTDLRRDTESGGYLDGLAASTQSISDHHTAAEMAHKGNICTRKVDVGG